MQATRVESVDGGELRVHECQRESCGKGEPVLVADSTVYDMWKWAFIRARVWVSSELDHGVDLYCQYRTV